MNRRGRVSLIGLFAVAFLGLLIAVLMFSRESLSTVGARFMVALGKGDVDTLTKMTYLGSASAEDIRKEWEFACHKAGRYYNFVYRISSSVQSDEKTGSVRMQIVRNAEKPGGYEENFQLPLVKVGDEWKVDVRAISREMYPALPQ